MEDMELKKRVRERPCEIRDQEVIDGRHLPSAATALPRFLARFEEHIYAHANLSRMRQVIAVAAVHHRSAWIHLFYDGNGGIVGSRNKAEQLFWRQPCINLSSR
jgi:Fic family protein